jgi:hypothetical protein
MIHAGLRTQRTVVVLDTLVALGIAALAALEPGAELEARHDITQTMAGRKTSGHYRRLNGDNPGD